MIDEQTRTLSLKAAYAFGAAHGLKQEVNDIRDMVVEWDYPYISTLRRGYVVELFERNGLFDAFKAKHWAFGNSPTGETQRRRFLRIKHSTRTFWPVDNRLRNANPLDQPIRKRLWSSRLRCTFGIFWPEISNE